MILALDGDILHTFYDRTIGYQATATRRSRSGGCTAGLGGAQHVVAGCGAVVLAVALAFVPRRRDVVGLAALCGAILIALQLGDRRTGSTSTSSWFFPLVMLALLGRFSEPRARAGRGISTCSIDVRPQRLASS